VISYDDPRVVEIARVMCRTADGSPCQGPGNDCDESNCTVIQCAMMDVAKADLAGLTP
jgi:hypothetical protein